LIVFLLEKEAEDGEKPAAETAAANGDLDDDDRTRENNDKKKKNAVVTDARLGGLFEWRRGRTKQAACCIL